MLYACASPLTDMTVMTNPRDPTDVPSTSSMSFRLTIPQETQRSTQHGQKQRHGEVRARSSKTASTVARAGAVYIAS